MAEVISVTKKLVMPNFLHIAEKDSKSLRILLLGAPGVGKTGKRDIENRRLVVLLFFGLLLKQ